MDVKEIGMVKRIVLLLVCFVVLMAARPVNVPAQDNPVEVSEQIKCSDTVKNS